jgi:phosphopantothenoylcysteine decarboxylase/phosphopantothenate--cysteine ligase
MTRAAREFVTPLTLQGLSGNPVLAEPFDLNQEESFGHLALVRWADIFMVAPATADLIARIRAGMANDAVTTPLVAFRGPVVLAPAMNTAMWENEITQANVAALRAIRRFTLVGPASGPLADGDVGPGRLAELPALVDALRGALPRGDFTGRRFLMTAGPTREAFDPVRFISNPSTGKMGIALAEAAWGRGAQVTLVLGPTSLAPRSGVDVVRVTSADEMLGAVLGRIDVVDAFCAAAAVADWKPSKVSPQKLKKVVESEIVEFVRTPDVLLTASTQVHALARRPLLVGFAAETEHLVDNAMNKLHAKKLDVIVANDVGRTDIGFAQDVNEVSVLSADGARRELKGTKDFVAHGILDVIAQRLANRSRGGVA